jgi:O-antigen/teichoic acid export membrane protein
LFARPLILLLLGSERYTTFNLIKNAQAFLYAAGRVAVMAAGGSSLFVVSAVWAIPTLVAGAAILLAGWRAQLHLWDASAVKSSEMLRFGLKGVVGQASPLEHYRVDQIILGILAGPAALGISGVGSSFSNLTRFVAVSVGMVAHPRIAASPAQARGHSFSFGPHSVVAGGIVLSLELLAGRLVPLFFGHEFSDAVPLTRIILISAFCFGLRRVLSDCLSGMGRPGAGSMAEVSSWLVAVPAMLVLGHLSGAQGVAWGLVMGSGTGLLLVLVISVKELRPSHAARRPLPSLASTHRVEPVGAVDVGGSS